MADRETVIRAMECCMSVENGCEGCPYSVIGKMCAGNRMLEDALELLKADPMKVPTDTIVLQPKVFISQNEYEKDRERLIEQIKDGGGSVNLLIIPAYYSATIVPTGTVVRFNDNGHVE